MKFKGGCHCGSVAKEIVPARYGFRDVAGIEARPEEPPRVSGD